jgi:hypothetical protein
MDSDQAPLLIFKMRGMSAGTSQKPGGAEVMAYQEELPATEKQQQAKPKAPPKTEEAVEGEGSPKTSIYYKEAGGYPNPSLYYKEAVKESVDNVQPVGGVMGAPKGRADSRERARMLFCSMHPFRHAYAICAYCHKPFCFEDIIEYQKDYYCMEDIGSIETKHVQKLSFEYSTSSFVTSSIMLGAFVLFFYYTHAQLIYTFNFVLSNPLGFVTNLGSNFAYLISIVTLGTMILAFGAALYILLGSRGGHMLASMLSIAAVVLLTYQYLGTLREYFAIIAVLEFAAFLSAVHAAAAGAMVYNQVEERGSEFALAYGYGAPY